jgi:hypothetical protein
MHTVSQCISNAYYKSNIAGSKHNQYTRREDILNGGNKQCLTLYEQDMNEEAYCNGSGVETQFSTGWCKE